jgi:serine/threonine protein kinase
MDPAQREIAITPGSIVGGKLRIIRNLGAGGMGAVYEVAHEITHHRRALKLLHPQMAQIPGVVERFLREASAAGRIGNPHIVETFDAGRLETGEPYIVMEMLEGKTLAAVLDERGRLDLESACAILNQACDAVGAAHAVGIVHRDLKPENLFLSGRDLSFVKILDFGISKFDTATTGVEGLTLEGSPLGTPCYMSPEQVQGEKSVDARTDVYALGVLLYECLTGCKPFLADTLPQLAVLIFEGKFTAPSELRPELGKSVDRVVAKAMARDPTERFASVQELALSIARLWQSLAPMALHEKAPSGTAPSLQSQRGAAALTPDVFSRPAAPKLKSNRGRVSKRWLWLTLPAIGLVALGVATAARHHTPRAVPEGSDIAGAIPEVALAAASPSTLVPTSTSEQNREADSAPMSLSKPVSVSAGTPGARRKRASDPPKASPTKAGSAAPPTKNRASSYGLTEANPFN